MLENHFLEYLLDGSRIDTRFLPTQARNFVFVFIFIFFLSSTNSEISPKFVIMVLEWTGILFFSWVGLATGSGSDAVNSGLDPWLCDTNVQTELNHEYLGRHEFIFIQL